MKYDWEDKYVEGAVGGQGGQILEDELYGDEACITLEDCDDRYAITCGIEGYISHVAFCSDQNFKETYENIKRGLQDFIDLQESDRDYARFARWLKENF